MLATENLTLAGVAVTVKAELASAAISVAEEVEVKILSSNVDVIATPALNDVVTVDV